MSGPLGSSQWMYNSGADFYNGVATQSLRFDDGSSANLYKNFSASNLKTNTFSFWVKRGNINSSQNIFSGGQGTSNNDFWLVFEAGNILTFRNITGGSYTAVVSTSRVFRDTSSWYHIVLALDTTQVTASNRVKIYVNGEQQTLTFTTTPAQDSNLSVNYAGNLYIGRLSYSAIQYLDGYLAEANFIDGTAYDASYFGEFKNGVWIAKEPSVTYGTNGFRLQFNQTGVGSGSSSTIGADTSGNDNHFTSSGIVASDCDMPDSPENNFATFNALDNDNITLSEGNLQGISTANAHNAVGTTFAVTGGKWYWEVRPSVADTAHFFGMGRATFSFISQYTNDSYTFSDLWAVAIDGNKSNGSGNVSYGSALAGGDILNIAFDLDNGKFYAGKNGTYFNSGDPVNGTNPAYSNVPTDEAMMPFYGSSTTPRSHIINFGQDSTFAGTETAGGNADGNGNGDFAYAPPSGFLALCTANLPEPTISPSQTSQADDYFNTVLYTGDSSTSRALTGVGFQPDFVWIKSRSTANNHNLNDSVRGANKQLYSNLTDAETSQTNNLKSFDSDGFTLGSDGDVNFSPRTYVAWNWKAGGTAVSNTDGSITSSVSANTDAGFSIVSYTGTDSATETIGHGLGAVPAMLIIKSRDSALNWAAYHKGSDATAPEDYLLRLNTTDAKVDVTSAWNDTAPTSSVFTVGTSSLVNNTDDFIAYCFAEIEGFSKFGSYTGNDNPDGNMIFTNFSPALVIIKYTSGSAGGTKNWFMWDNTRSPQNPNDNILYSNTSGTEDADTVFDIDFLSNGFKIRNAEGGVNNGAEYIYMAWASIPFKYSLAR
jgi:hypothetical protein